MKKILKLLICSTMVLLCGCQVDPNADFLNDAQLLEQYEDREIKFSSYDDLLNAYKLNEAREKELLTQMIELFLASDPNDLCNITYATYYGNIGRSLLEEYNIFKNIKYIGKGSSNISHNIENYWDYFNNNKTCHMVGNLLLKIEKDLKDGKTKQTLDDLNKIYKYIDEFKEVGVNE